jgi:hypothetical protein
LSEAIPPSQHDADLMLGCKLLLWGTLHAAEHSSSKFVMEDRERLMARE